MSTQNVVIPTAEIEINGKTYETLKFGVYIMGKIQQYLMDQQNEAIVKAATSAGVNIKDVLSELNKPVAEDQVQEHLKRVDVMKRAIFYGIKYFNPDFDYCKLDTLEAEQLGDMIQKIIPTGGKKKKAVITENRNGRKPIGKK